MRTANLRLKLLLALAVVALLALPGVAKTAAPSDPDQTAQAAFGLFLDPHAEPVLHIELPGGYPAF